MSLLLVLACLQTAAVMRPEAVRALGVGTPQSRTFGKHAENRFNPNSNRQPAGFFCIYSSMPTYFFRVRTPDRLAHRVECHEFADLNAALIKAQRAARSLIRNPARRGNKVIGGSLDIENEDNRAVARLMLTEVAHQIT